MEKCKLRDIQILQWLSNRYSSSSFQQLAVSRRERKRNLGASLVLWLSHWARVCVCVGVNYKTESKAASENPSLYFISVSLADFLSSSVGFYVCMGFLYIFIFCRFLFYFIFFLERYVNSTDWPIFFLFRLLHNLPLSGTALSLSPHTLCE